MQAIKNDVLQKYHNGLELNENSEQLNENIYSLLNELSDANESLIQALNSIIQKSLETSKTSNQKSNDSYKFASPNIAQFSKESII